MKTQEAPPEVPKDWAGMDQRLTSGSEGAVQYALRLYPEWFNRARVASFGGIWVESRRARYLAVVKSAWRAATRVLIIALLSVGLSIATWFAPDLITFVGGVISPTRATLLRTVATAMAVLLPAASVVADTWRRERRRIEPPTILAWDRWGALLAERLTRDDLKLDKDAVKYVHKQRTYYARQRLDTLRLARGLLIGTLALIAGRNFLPESVQSFTRRSLVDPALVTSVVPRSRMVADTMLVAVDGTPATVVVTTHAHDRDLVAMAWQVVLGFVAALLVAGLANSTWWYHQHVETVVEFYGTQRREVILHAAGLPIPAPAPQTPRANGGAFGRAALALVGLTIVYAAIRPTDR